MKDILSARLESPAFSADAIELHELTGREVVSQPFEFQLHVVCKTPEGLDEEALLAEPAALVFLRGDREERRLFGVISVVRDALHTETLHMAYTLTFVPRAFRMTLTETSEIFMDLTVPEVIKTKLQRAGLQEGDDFELRLVSDHPPREYIVQYKETDLHFVSRLAEHLGISFFFEHRDGRDVIVFSDANSGFQPIAGGGRAHFYPRGDRLGVYRLEGTTRTIPSRYVVKDYNYRTPHVPLMAAATVSAASGGDIVEYGAHFKTPDEAERIAAIRAEELRAGRKVFDGASDVQALAAGARLTLEGHPRGDVELLLVEVRHRLQQATLNAGTGNERAYANEFRAIPFSTAYRPPRLTPKPRVHGVITGVIDAAAKGQYAEVDETGRYRVRFLFDTSAADDGKASRLIRMAQPHAGAGYGFHFPLRSGVEVILTFIDGDPDRPIIAGAVPNPHTPSTVDAKNARRNVIRTGGGNEINIDDNEGEERIKLSTPYGGATFQLGSPNTPEAGAAITTKEAYTAVANAGVSTLTSVSTVMSDVASVLASGNIVNHAGAASVMEALKGEKGQKLLDGVLGVAKSVVDTNTKWHGLQHARLDEEAVKAQARVDALERSVTSRMQTIDFMTRPEGDNAKGASRPTTRQEWDASHPEDVQRIAKATEEAKAAKALADSYKTLNAESDDAVTWRTAGDWIETAKAGSAARKARQDLISSTTKIAQRSMDHTSVATAKGMALLANGFASAGRVPSPVPTPGAPINLNSAAVTSAITANVSAFVCGNANATMSSTGHAIVAGGAVAVLKSGGAVEIAGRGSALVTSDACVDLLSLGLMKLKSSLALTIDSGNVVEIESGTRLGMKAGGSFEMRATGPLLAESSGTVDIKSSGATNIKSSGAMNLKSAGKVTVEGSTALVKGGQWSLNADTATVTVGNQDSRLAVTGSQARLIKGGSMCSVTSGTVEMLAGSTKVTVGKGAVKVTARRIDLG
ncbi:type VI secretion system tip protein TssI/VgrG [Sorangium sp. So ce117]|uniref:type VI secretion system Vgr family protein n=1 Tax=Sorangium sp. So ce117 TaxID=3133277 RepID=UPI003F640C77